MMAHKNFPNFNVVFQKYSLVTFALGYVHKREGGVRVFNFPASSGEIFEFRKK